MLSLGLGGAAAAGGGPGRPVQPQQLQRMQNAMEGALGAWIANSLHPSSDAHELRTKIGSSGQIAQSGKIVLRVRPEPGGFVPGWLREATWDAYKQSTWSTSNLDFALARTGVDDSVKLLPANSLSSEVEIARYYENGQGPIDLPHGTFEIEDMPYPVQTNRLGAARFDSGPGLLIMRASFGPGRSIDSPPCERDLAVPPEEVPALDDTITESASGAMNELQKIRAVAALFP